ncbi:hypothetical protein COV53_03555 [Candidatus Gottesmanbacteria bacterium CG11_big_fil_rev_8_21_14_0_20_37_11]|uniref:Phosphodiester glycosidase domain-containing protein n=3 Tax=Candidatus Gottesmaniibacteriota TaxID=1752720 RepID=A0A2M7RR25_9BACT|nr:MAG: hypothetical protein AUJ73_03540 [Candidatus Gottesmanbacteria bacterium CG1_02_37_22]PIP33274.1 MAG: hypothetical protein COX23_00250 [Candidatus Gottesmanbacteria bacterium CG23_combo_of_CG06-09_8_20_14_all_37_19]PIR08338.1 MAG: hypothetical protein COV53_03555 [Candidatus Gottesmanbacteria bacterium CG11_big_fil_rev_8_21_14_0_20_37_11]PIZ02758.1 MAG: hypothetical protein COY59_03065 [Candidatus Gottesmanbacteria bacterium CG_4_10_14_0_8_um_filter_37_24]
MQTTKLFFTIIIFILIGIFLLVKGKQPNDETQIVLPIITSVTSNPEDRPDVNPNNIEITYENDKYVIDYLQIPKRAKLNLIANFEEKESGLTLANKFNCDYAINGGFYQKNDKPLGLFITNGEKYGELTASSIANGFFWEDKNGDRFIGKNLPVDFNKQQFILQTGPYIHAGEYKLKMVRDEKSRRMLLAVDSGNLLYFVSIYMKDSLYEGPYLSDVPNIFSKEEVQKKLKINSLLNLDGGTASFFYMKGNQSYYILSELTSIGSLFCLNNPRN